MKKINFYMTLPMYSALKDLSDASGLSFAEHLRRAIDLYLAYIKEEK